MVRPFCQCTDARCARQLPQPASGSDTIGISGSVGAGGFNKPDDVRVIQQALNEVDPGQGGADPKLKVDGWIGPKTIAAISKFQLANLGWADGRIDPHGPTLAKLNTLVSLTSVLTAIAQLLGLGAVPSIAVDPATMEDLYRNVLPEVGDCVRSADATLQLARNTLFSGPSPFNIGTDAARLVNKHFSIDQNPHGEKDFDFISEIYYNMQALIHRNNSPVVRTFVAFPGTISATDLVTQKNAIADASADGKSSKGQTHTVVARDGTRITLKDDEIHIFPADQFQTRDGQVKTLLHEMSHYLGGPDGSADCIDDFGYGWVEMLASLKPHLKSRNADCYGNFAFDAHYHRQPFILPS
jgi:hypothetical protein